MSATSPRSSERARRLGQPSSQRALIALTQVLSLAVWFSVSAVVPSMQQDLMLNDSTTVWLTGTVQIGFVVGALTATILNLSDRVRPNILLGLSAVLAAVCTFSVAVFAEDVTVALILRFATGVCLAGVYPVGMKLMASWASAAERGAAMGLLIGALTLGSTLPHLISGFAVLPWRTVLNITAAVALLGAVIAFTVIRVGPHLPQSSRSLNPRYLLTMFAEAGPRRVNLGYFGHMWKLYALWTWIPLFVLNSPASPDSRGYDQAMIFFTLGVVGYAGCRAGGRAADRYGREKAAVVALSISGLCCLLSPLAFVAPAPVLAIFCGVWGASVIADSGVFSAMLSEVADQRYVGTALSAQTAIGFAITVASIQLVSLIANVSSWQLAFLALVPGPLLGVIAMLRFRQPAG